MKKQQKILIEWRWRAFEELTLSELDDLYRLRQTVFVVEQNCPYLDADGKDQYAHHLLGYLDKELVATLRFFSQYFDYNNQASLGRVCTAESVRRFGVGRELLQQAVSFAEQNHPRQSIQIGAQSYLEKFYASFGFETISEEYLEDDIPHILMRRSPADKAN